MTFLGLDLSTQQLKGVIVDDRLAIIANEKVQFDEDLPGYQTVKGVIRGSDNSRIIAPVAMWLDALDLLLSKFDTHMLSQVEAISGACQQHGAVFWSTDSLRELDGQASLAEQLKDSLSWPFSPNWQDHSTEKECKEFEEAVGGAEQLAALTGSKAYHRFTGPQILYFKRSEPQAYEKTRKISLVSSFLESVLAGKLVPFEVSDVCGMNLWELNKGQWAEPLLSLIDRDTSMVKRLLGSSISHGRDHGNKVSSYFVSKYGLNKDCKVVPFTGDNPGTILALPLTPNDVMVSLGTSTTALVVTEQYHPSPLYHLFSHPTGKGYMGMLCYCNGALAREQIRDKVNKKFGEPQGSWDRFNELAQGTGPLAETKVGFYFPLPEIIPKVKAQAKRIEWDGESCRAADWDCTLDPRAILESQALSIRSRLRPMLTTDSRRPRKVYFVGGASHNDAIVDVLSRVLMPLEGSYTLDLVDACATGAANKAAFAMITAKTKESWEAFITSRWNGATPVAVAVKDDVYRDCIDKFDKSEACLDGQ